MAPEALSLPGFGPPPSERMAPVPAAAINLRPYQTAAISRIRSELMENRSTLLVAATGSGKTTIFAELARTWRGRVLVIAHRDELIMQGARRLAEMTGEIVEIEQADLRAQFGRIVMASIQSISRPSRLQRFQPDAFSLVIVDEAHHAIASTYRAVIDYFTGAKVLGVTATPDRGDRLAMGQVFDSVAMVYDIADAINDKWLCPIVPVRIQLDVDLSQIKTTAGDLNQGQLDDAMGEQHVLEGVVRPTFEQAGPRKTVVFTTSVLNAHKMAAIFNAIKPDCAQAVDGTMEMDRRRAVLGGYARGEFQFLVNVGIATEGWDDPPTACVAVGRPTKSRALFAQMIGRGLRIYPGKVDCLVLDFAGNAGKHSLVSPMDILAGKYTDEEVALAKEVASKNPGIRADVALKQAHEEIKRRAAKRVRYQASKFDPFGVLHMDADDDMDWQFGKKDPSQKQIDLLGKFGVDAKEMSRRQASKLIGTVFKRRELGLASLKQLKTLQRYGITDINIGFRKASDLMNAIADNGWRALPLDRVSAILGRDREPGEDG